jgi:hypothetical protein
LDLGLKPETADMYHTTFYRDNVGYEIIQVRNEKLPLLSQETPAWSLHRLIEILDAPLIEFNVLSYNPYEEIIDLISGCLKLKRITNKEYLKQ